MKAKLHTKNPEIVLREGKPAAVILDIEVYRELLELLEDAKDLKMLNSMRKKALKFKRIDDFIKEVKA